MWNMIEPQMVRRGALIRCVLPEVLAHPIDPCAVDDNHRLVLPTIAITCAVVVIIVIHSTCSIFATTATFVWLTDSS